MAMLSKPDKNTKMICVGISGMSYAFDSSSLKSLSAIVPSSQTVKQEIHDCSSFSKPTDIVVMAPFSENDFTT